mmetsp:Transcript_15164/g.35991  ORF Transcript_15164/g.35991 Transcript_15164/m.35991 type:complete len:327 (-) Transcript_15164:3009-3989(-)
MDGDLAGPRLDGATALRDELHRLRHGMLRAVVLQVTRRRAGEGADGRPQRPLAPQRLLERHGAEALGMRVPVLLLDGGETLLREKVTLGLTRPERALVEEGPPENLAEGRGEARERAAHEGVRPVVVRRHGALRHLLPGGALGARRQLGQVVGGLLQTLQQRQDHHRAHLEDGTHLEPQPGVDVLGQPVAALLHAHVRRLPQPRQPRATRRLRPVGALEAAQEAAARDAVLPRRAEGRVVLLLRAQRERGRQLLALLLRLDLGAQCVCVQRQSGAQLRQPRLRFAAVARKEAHRRERREGRLGTGRPGAGAAEGQIRAGVERERGA